MVKSSISFDPLKLIDVTNKLSTDLNKVGIEMSILVRFTSSRSIPWPVKLAGQVIEEEFVRTIKMDEKPGPNPPVTLGRLIEDNGQPFPKKKKKNKKKK